jgi:hypothetical protein
MEITDQQEECWIFTQDELLDAAMEVTTLATLMHVAWLKQRKTKYQKPP